MNDFSGEWRQRQSEERGQTSTNRQRSLSGSCVVCQVMLFPSFARLACYRGMAQLTTCGHVLTPTTSNQIMWRTHLPFSVIPLDLLILRNKITSSVWSKQMREVKETRVGLCFVIFPATSKPSLLGVYYFCAFSSVEFQSHIIHQPCQFYQHNCIRVSESGVWRLLTSKRLRRFISLLHKRFGCF